MVRTIEEVYNLILQKTENAKNAYCHNNNRKYPSVKTGHQLEGQIMSYQDISNLIESSHLLQEDGLINQAKEIIEKLKQNGKASWEIIKLLDI